MTAQDPVAALGAALRATAVRRSLVGPVDEPSIILAALPPGWRLVGPDAVVVTVEDVARRLFGSPDGWGLASDQCRDEARRLLGQEGE